MTEQQVYYDANGRAYTVRDGVSEWLPSQPVAGAAQFEPYAVPAVAPLPGPMLEYVGFWLRAAARLIDLAIIYALAFASGVVFAILVTVGATLCGTDAQAPLKALQVQGPWSFVVSLLAATAFYVIAESLHGSTPGKLILGFTVRSEDGSPCGGLQAVKRSLAYFIDSLIFGVPALTTMRTSPRLQRIGDKWAKTVVVRTRSIPESERRTGLRFAGVTVLASAVYVALAMVSIAA